jgi:hypothetical protein
MLEARSARWRPFFSAIGVGALLALIAAGPATAGPGYELDSVKPSIALAGEGPHGVAIDQSNGTIYVTELTTDLQKESSGQIEQFNSSGFATAGSPFVTGGTDFFTGVAVNPVTQGIYAYQTQLSTPSGLKGVSRMNTFSSAGVAGASFNPAKSTGPQLAADAAGRVYFPNDGSGTVQVFSASGTLESSISCTSCPGGGFVKPLGVALDSSGNLYVVDIAGKGQVIKFKTSGGSYVYDSVLQSGEGAVAVGVDPGSGDVFVGDYGGGGYHVVAYDSSGTQFDDFGGGTVGPPPFGIETAGQIAANATTHKVYVSDPSSSKLWIFDRVTSIPAPTASTSAASSPGQLDVTLNATVNPQGHGLRACRFEYIDHADFLVNGFAAAASMPCPSKPVGSSSVAISAHVAGLTPATSYDYRIAVTSNGGSAEGTAQTFETLPPLAPTNTTGSASAITQTTATLAGSVNPHGGPVSNCHFEYTNEADFQANAFTHAVAAPCVPILTGTVSKAVLAKVSGLAANTKYRFRLVATNNSGTSQATDEAFTTLADTCATNPALCPPPAEEKHETIMTPPIVIPLPAPSAPVKKPLKCHKGFKKKTVHGKPKCIKVKKPKRHG